MPFKAGEQNSTGGGKRPGKVQAASPRQIMAVGLFIAGDTRSEALRKAGYSRSSWHDSASNIFECPSFKAELERHQNRLRQKYHLDEDWVIERMMRLADAGETLSKFKKVVGKGLEWDFTGATQEELVAINEIITTERTVPGEGSTVTVKIGYTDPKAALDSLMRKLGLFKDNLDITGAMSLVDRINAGRDQLRAGDDAKLINGEVVDD